MKSAELTKKITRFVPQWNIAAKMHGCRLNFTSPSRDRLYYRILKVLEAAGGPMTLTQVYSQITGPRKTAYGWTDHTTMTALVFGRLVDQKKRGHYTISLKGRKYLSLVEKYI